MIPGWARMLCWASKCWAVRKVHDWFTPRGRLYPYSIVRWIIVEKYERLATERESPMKRKARLDGLYGMSVASYLDSTVGVLEEI